MEDLHVNLAGQGDEDQEESPGEDASQGSLSGQEETGTILEEEGHGHHAGVGGHEVGSTSYNTFPYLGL